MQTQVEPSTEHVAPRSRTQLPRLRVRAAGPDSPIRSDLEEFVRRRFERTHGAHVRSFMPTLLSIEDRWSQRVGVIGLRCAAEGPLYLEQYLDLPIERAIAARMATPPPDRRDIVEIGNLACPTGRAGLLAISVLPAYLVARGYAWIAFTATRTVRRLLQELNAPNFELAEARESRVATAPDHWGSYYAQEPRVHAARLRDGLRLPGFRTLIEHDA
jgi:Thermostable hemolysin